jgi:hypothetical protein
MAATEIADQGSFIRRVKIGLGMYATLYQIGEYFYTVSDRVIEFGTNLTQANRYLDLIKADI